MYGWQYFRFVNHTGNNISNISTIQLTKLLRFFNHLLTIFQICQPASNNISDLSTILLTTFQIFQPSANNISDLFNHSATVADYFSDLPTKCTADNISDLSTIQLTICQIFQSYSWQYFRFFYHLLKVFKICQPHCWQYFIFTK